MNDPKSFHHPQIIEAIIKQRRSLKVLCDVDRPTQISADVAIRNKKVVLESIEVAGWAPFHYDRGVDGITEPWRAHVLWHTEAQKVASQLRDWFDDIPTASKEPRLLSACSAVVLVTWLPQFYDVESPLPSQIAIDEEHLAAASAMVQNLLLMLTAHGMGTYWSSGNKLRSPLLFEKLGIPAAERLIAAVFVDYPEAIQRQEERLPGKHRDKRSARWIREVSV